jgi:hypothetical protein
MHVLHFLRWLALFASPPSPPLSEGELPYSPSSPTPSSPTPPPPLPRHDQHKRPIARVQPLPPISPIPPYSQAYNDHENIVWAGATNHPARRSCYHAGGVGHYSCSLGRPCLRPHGPSSAQYPAIDPPIPHRATNGIQSVHGQHDISPEEREENSGWTAGATAADAQQQRSAANLE